MNGLNRSKGVFSAMKLHELVPSFDGLMGVKAVYGPSPGPEAVMCFGPNGTDQNNRAYYSHASNVVKAAMKTPYFITLGGGANVDEKFRGRAVEVVKATLAYGKTDAFVKEPSTLERLKQWPTAVVLSEVYEIVGMPSLVKDLGFKDMSILLNAFDAVRFYDELMEQLWKSLENYDLRRRWEVEPPPGFKEPNKPSLSFTLYPTLSVEEGKARLRTTMELERKSEAADEAKLRNLTANGNKYKCEACSFEDELRSLFDAHHIQPLATGPRISTVDSYAILCPLCHRMAHHKGQNIRLPLSVAELRHLLSTRVSGDIEPRPQ
jgi:5-methylcytosine-specific restriction enzyme A